MEFSVEMIVCVSVSQPRTHFICIDVAVYDLIKHMHKARRQIIVSSMDFARESLSL